MPNHFHFLVQCKSESELFDFIVDDPKSRRFLKFDVPEIQFQIESFEEKKARPKRVEVSADYSALLAWQFARLFNSYTKAMNKKYNRKGSLFNHSFKRKSIPEQDLVRVRDYIHNNPVNHGFSNYPDEWEFSSIHIYNSKEDSWIQKLY
jgi:REP element-mobilizing transposase RayT